jgi:hypothetical protein
MYARYIKSVEFKVYFMQAVNDLNVLIPCPLWINSSGSISRELLLRMADVGSEGMIPQTTWCEDAVETMRLYGEDVLKFIEETLGEVPTMSIYSWRTLAVELVTLAVDLWVKTKTKFPLV